MFILHFSEEDEEKGEKSWQFKPSEFISSIHFDVAKKKEFHGLSQHFKRYFE